MSASLRPVSGDAEGILALLREWEAAVDPAPLTIATSGSTGRPKQVMLSRSAMRASVDATHAWLGAPGQWLLNLPPTYVAGVQVLFRSVRAGIEPLITDRLDLGGDYVSLVPTQLHRLLDAPEPLRAFKAVLIGGGPARPEDLARAEAAGVRVVRTYGMSETCGGCVYDGRPLDGVEIDIRDGSVWLRGPMLFDGYVAEPERTAHVLVDGWLRTNDLGRIDDGVLSILGREDDVIISGGVKVPAQAVEQMLGGGAVVIGLPDAEWGERVVAVFEGDAPGLNELRDRVQPRAWAPRETRSIDAFPLLSNGKLDRLAVRELVR